MDVSVIRPGMLTTVQDIGRVGYRHAGVPLSGAMDRFALSIANALVGNSESAAALELSLVGPELEFAADAVVALAGAECEGMPAWKPLRLVAGARLALGRFTRGGRGVLAIGGGIDVPLVMASRSTYLRGGFGGLEGRALRAGDRLIIGNQRAVETAVEVPATETASGHVKPRSTARVSGWRIDPQIFPRYSTAAVVRLLPGAQAHQFSDIWQGATFSVSPQSDRMGIRLGGAPLSRTTVEDLLSSAVAPGTIQVPPDGNPLVLMADAQTIGGYPQLGHVIGVDLPVVAQLCPGDTLRFEAVTLAEAHRLAVENRHAVALVRQGLAAKMRKGAHSIPVHMAGSMA